MVAGDEESFLARCIAKKKESRDIRHDQYIDAVLNFNDINRWLGEEEIVIEACEDENHSGDQSESESSLSGDQWYCKFGSGDRGKGRFLPEVLCSWNKKLH